VKSNNRSTTCYYRTLYSKYGVDDSFLQSRAQRRAAGAFLERVDNAQAAQGQVVDPRQHRRLKRAFRDTPFFTVVSATATAAAMVLLLQSTPAHATQASTKIYPLIEKSISNETDQFLILDEDSYSDSKKPLHVQPTPDLLSVHLITEQPLYCPVTFGEHQLLIDDDSDIEPLHEKQNVLTVIDTTVDDWALLQAAVTEGEILLLEEGASLEAIIEKMARMESVETLNIISHGKPGSILLNDHEFSNATLQQHMAKWQKIGNMLTRDGDLKLYGCNIGQGQEGREFVEKLADITSADVAASVNYTGNSAQDGDWNLELVVGELNTDKHVLSQDVRHFPHVLAFNGTLNMSGFTNGYGASQSYTVPTTSYNFRGSVDSTTLYFFSRIYADPDGDDSGGNTVTLDFTSGESFNATSIYLYSCASVGDSTNIKITSDKGDTTTSGVLNDSTGATINLNWTGITKLYLQENNSIPLKCFGIDDLVLTNLQPAPSTDSDGTLTAAGSVTEPVNLPTTASSGAPVSVFDFTIADGGSADGLTLDVSQIDLNLSGTSSGNFSKMRFNLSGCATKSAVAPSGSTVSFTSTGISVADGGNTACTVAAYWQDNTGITDDQTLAISLDGDTDLTVDGAKTQMSGANSAVATGNMSTAVIATGLSFATQPAGSVSGVALTTQPVVRAVDAAGNVDTDFAETITLTEASAGTLSGGTQAASSGVATFTSLTYSASADQESFTLTANDQDGVGSDLPTANANAVTSDVVATKLIVATEPSPTSVLSGSPTAFSTVPVVSAVNAADIVDTGYGTSIVVSEVNGAGSATMTGTGDTDGNGATVTLTPTSGTATFTGLTVTYTNSGGSAETFNLRASSGGLSTADSTLITSDVLSVTSATYNAGTGALVVTGAGFEAKTGAVNDVTANKFTIVGESAQTYTLTTTANVEIDNATQFTLTLSAADKLHVDGLLNKNGTVSDDSTTYNLAAADDWMANITAGDTSDLTGNGITVSNVATPAITSATYNFSTGGLIVTGTGFVRYSGASNDVAVTTLTLTGEGGGTYTLTTADVEVTSATGFTVTLSATDMQAVNGLLNKDGTQADGGTTFNLAAADNWMRGAAPSTNIQDLTGNGVTVSNYFAPSVTSATYNAGTGVLTVTGTGFVSASGATNDVDVTQLTLTGQASGTQQLTTSNVEVSSDTSFSATLNSADKTAVNLLLNKDGTSAVDAVTYNLAAADDWMTAAPASQNIADTTGNGVTASNVDAAAPTISAVAIPNAAIKVGDVVTATLTVASDADDYTTGLGELSGTIGGFALSGLSRTNTTTYTAQFTIVNGGTDVAASSNVPVSLTLADSVGNTSSTFTTPVAQGSDSIDANLPVISNVSVPNVAMNVGDAVTVTITAGETGLSLSSGTVNGVTVTGFTDNADNTYSATYTIVDGGTDRAAGDSIPVSFVLQDGAGNNSATYTTAISQGSDSIDANNPGISSVTIPNTAMNVGDAVTVTITAGEAGLTLVSGTVNSVAVTGFTDNGGGSYSATYTIVNGGTDRAAGDSIPVSFVLQDGAGNVTSTYTTAISQGADSIDANNPNISNVTLPNTAMNVGDAVTVTITAGEAGLTLVSGTVNGVSVTGFTDNGGGSYSATYTIVNGGTDRAIGDNIPVSFVLQDGAGNNSAAYTTAISQGSDSIDANLPVISNVSVPNVAMNVGDAVTVTITAGETGLSLSSGTVNGVTVTGFTDNADNTYSATYTIVDGGTDRAAGDSIPVSFVLQDGGGNVSSTYTTAISQGSDSIDANNPGISNVTLPDTAMNVGDAVTVTITAGEAGLTLVSGTVNSVAVTGFTDNGGGSYSATYTIVNGGTDRAAGDSIPVSFVLQDGAGNVTSTYTTAISQGADSIDANNPVITNVTVPNTAMNVGDAVTVTITAGEAGLTLVSGTVNGVSVTGFTDNGGGSYSATYTIVNGGTDRAAGDSIPVSFVLQDGAGNVTSTYTTAISQGADSIDANNPDISNVTLPNTAMNVGDAVTVTITASEAGLTLVSGTVNGVAVTGFTDNSGGSYSATYTIVNGGTDRAAGDSIPVSFVLQDGAGNVTSTYTTAISQGADSIDANLPGSASGVLAVDENTGNGTSVGTVTASDADTYSLTDDAGGRFAIGAASGEVTVANGSLLDFESNAAHNITVRVTDSGGNTIDTVMAVTINDANDLPTGSVTISGTAAEDQTLTAANTLADQDGLGTISYQWQRDSVDIGGATNTTYTLGDADVGTVITVVASYIDGNAANESVASSPTSAVSGVNDTPVITNVNGDVITFPIGNAAVVLDDGADATLTDVDSVDLNGGNVTVAITANRVDTEDQLRVGAVGNINTSGSDVTHTDGVTIGTFAGGSGANNLVIALNANATVARVRDLLSALQYINTDPATFNTAARTVSLTADDGDGGASTSVSHSVTVNLVLAPTLDLDGDDSSGATGNDFNGSFTENDGDVPVTDTDTSIVDDGGNTHLALTVTLSNPLDGTAESLGSTLGTGTQAIASDVVSIAAYDTGTGVLAINVDGSDGDGELAASTLVTLMESVRYNNTADVPATTARTITLTATDRDSNTGVAATATLTIIAVNDSPAFSNLDGAPAFTEGGAAVVLDSNVTVADAELDAANDYNGATLTLVRNGGTNAVDQFANSGTLSALTEGGSFNLGGGAIGTVTMNTGGTLVLSFNATTTTVDVNSAMQQLTYSNGSDAPSGTVQIDWSLDDGNSGSQGTGGALAVSGSTTVAITGVNDNPSGTVTISGSAIEYQTLTVDTSGLTDPDGLGTLSYQWQSNGANVGANSASYSLVAGDIGNTVTVTVSYTDAGGTPESVISSPSAVVANTNDAPTGSVTITGTVTEDQTLTADTSGLSDADGLGAFSYQWLRGGVNISGATGNTYGLGDDDVGATLAVTVSYTDGYGTVESVTSSATAAVANVNDAPTGTVTLSGTAEEDQTLTASHTLADADGLGTVGYQWQRAGIDISGATQATYTLTDADVNAAISVVASYTDTHGTLESMASTATSAVANVNDDPTGAVTISGEAKENQTLTAANTLSDDDGLGTINYQWHRNGSAIGGATGDSYLLTLDDVGASLTVTASYTDGHGNVESMTSSASAIVQIANQLPLVTAPEDITVNATGLFTEVDLGQATALDAEDGVLAASTDSDRFFSPGTHTVTWRAVDLGGGEGLATQTVNVIPLVSFSKHQDSAEGSTASIKVILNGPAVSYPVTVPFTVGGSAFTDGSDHDLADGAITIDSPHLEASITVTFVDDGAGEGLESLQLTMGTPTHAVTGAVTTHVIDIYEDNVAPEVTLTADQGDGNTRIVGQTDGLITVTANVSDPNSGDSHSYDWSRTDNALVDTDSVEDTFTIDPSGLTPGIYTLAVTVSDGEATAASRLRFRVEATLPTLTDSDSDGDGIDDDIEGLGDSDGDGVPDYLDHASAARNVVQELQANVQTFLMETEPGLALTLGQVAFRAHGDRTNVTADDIATHANNGTGAQSDDEFHAYNGGLFDFNVEDLPVAGQSVRVVIAQFAAIPANAVYRKQMASGWQNFVEDANNSVASAPGAAGYCPPPGDAAYTNGLTEGHWCVQLTLEDGGPNDADGQVNQAVDDPGGVAERLSQTVGITVSGSGALNLWSMTLLMLLVLLRSPRGRKLLISVLLLGSTATTHAQSEWMPDYAGLSYLSANSDERDSNFDRELNDLGLDARVRQSDLDRHGFALHIGYVQPDNVRIEIGYVDLGDVSTKISGTAIDVDNFIDSASGVYPVTASGLTLSMGRAWSLHDQIDLLAAFGPFFWNAEYTLKSASTRRSFDENGMGAQLLVGLEIKTLDKFPVRLGWRHFWFDNTEVSAWELGVGYWF